MLREQVECPELVSVSRAGFQMESVAYVTAPKGVPRVGFQMGSVADVKAPKEVTKCGFQSESVAHMKAPKRMPRAEGNKFACTFGFDILRPCFFCPLFFP